MNLYISVHVLSKQQAISLKFIIIVSAPKLIKTSNRVYESVMYSK